jgi:hypothetical protein
MDGTSRSGPAADMSQPVVPEYILDRIVESGVRQRSVSARLHGASSRRGGVGCGHGKGGRHLQSWLLDATSSTHNEFRIPARPLSGESGRFNCPC